MKFHERPLIYVAGAYSLPEPVENAHIAIKVGDRLNATGVMTALVPHATMVWQLVCPHADVDYWYDYDLALLARCDALLRIPGRSVGADDEVQFAMDREIPVFFEEDKLLDWAQEWNGPN